MDCRIIKSPSEGTMAILNRRKGSGIRDKIRQHRRRRFGSRKIDRNGCSLGYC
jgi:hypothetical protein